MVLADLPDGVGWPFCRMLNVLAILETAYRFHFTVSHGTSESDANCFLNFLNFSSDSLSRWSFGGALQAQKSPRASPPPNPQPILQCNTHASQMILAAQRSFTTP
jgi:hypothetical protein